MSYSTCAARLTNSTSWLHNGLGTNPALKLVSVQVEVILVGAIVRFTQDSDSKSKLKRDSRPHKLKGQALDAEHAERYAKGNIYV